VPKQNRDLLLSRTAAQIGSDHGGDHQLQNHILLSLPRAVRHELLGNSQYIHLPTHAVLNEVNAVIEHAYFIDGGLASVLSVLRNGKSVEVGMTGKEGFVGVPLIAGFKTSPTRVIMQGEGSAFRIGAKDLAEAQKSDSLLGKNLQRYSQELGLQASQVAACNRAHEVDRRLARWLLMSQDRMGGELIPLTQEFLAHMLGTRRASVTVSAGRLQKAGLISYVRGQLRIADRDRLENAACECYGALQRQLETWKSETL
jgi:CRP-like cAMP-binding protein